ncbi:MAG: 2Fe-2S iron-sulfur cluster-binding protein [Rhodospirillaceae bacterium]|jgi:ferredoxin
MIEVTFILSSGDNVAFQAEEGQTLLDIARANDLPIEGACEGAMACSTCHVIVSAEWFDELQDPSEEEQDMLDLTHGLTRTSRLGCQIRLTPNLNGLLVSLPSETHNMLG